MEDEFLRGRRRLLEAVIEALHDELSKPNKAVYASVYGHKAFNDGVRFASAIVDEKVLAASSVLKTLNR